MRRRKRDSDRRHASRTAAPERGKAARDIERAIHALKDFQAASQLPRPDQFPGTVPQMPVSPDLIKLDYATWVERQPRLAEQLRQLQDDYERGTLHWVDAARSWALEEFLWHGYPGGDSSPLDHYLDAREAKYPAEALEQLRQWKVAKFGMFRVGRVRRDAVELTPIDSRGTSTGPMCKAISLNVGGVNVFLGRRGDTLITYVAPWSEEPCIACCMGYGTTWPAAGTALLSLQLGFCHPTVAATPCPWLPGAPERPRYLREWSQRDWYDWFDAQLDFPFDAVVQTPNGPQVHEVAGLEWTMASTKRDFGVYFTVPLTRKVLICGATGLRVLDVTSRNCRIVEEYHAYRQWAGPPQNLPPDARFIDT